MKIDISIQEIKYLVSLARQDGKDSLANNLEQQLTQNAPLKMPVGRRENGVSID